MALKLKLSGNYEIAKNAIERATKGGDLQSQLNLVTVAFSLTGDARLISRNIPFGKRYSLAFQHLIGIIQKELSVASKEEGEEISKDTIEPDEPELVVGRPETSGYGGRRPVSDDESVDQTIRVDSHQATTWFEEVKENFEQEQGEKQEEYIPPTPEKMEIADYYEVLGVDQDASLEDIKKAYRQQVRIHHPDVSDLPAEEAHEQAILINEAFAILSNEDSRKIYDSKLNKARETSPRSKSGTYTYPYEPPASGDVYTADTSPTEAGARKTTPDKNNLMINILVSEEESFDKTHATKQTQELYGGFGHIEFDQETINQFREHIPDMPEGMENEILNAGAFTFMHGVEDERFENAINQAQAGLSQQELSIVSSIRRVNQIFYAGAPELGDNLRRASNFQDIEISRTDQSEPSSLGILVSQGKDIAIGQIKKGASKAVKTFFKKAAGKGIKQLAKEAAIAVAGEAVGGPVGHFILEVASKILGKIWGFIKKLIPESIRKRSKEIAAAGLLLIGGGIMGGSVAMVVGGGLMVAVGGLGGAGGVAATLGGALALMIAAFTSAAASFIGWVVVAIGGTILLIAIIIYMITVGAYVVPYTNISITTGYGLSSSSTQSLYMDVEKTASPTGGFENSDLSGSGTTITYTISIAATTGTLVVTDIDYECFTIKEGVEPGCPSTDPSPPFSDVDLPITIEPGEPDTFTYTQTFQGAIFSDTGIRDTVTVTGDADEQAGTQESASAYIFFGDPPDDCPNGWPIGPEGAETSLPITQGPLGTYSHFLYQNQAIDISASTGHTVWTTHSGTAQGCALCGKFGTHVRVYSTCQGVQFHTIYAHLQSVSLPSSCASSGCEVEFGDIVGLSDDTGWSSGAHLHYETYGLTINDWIPFPVEVGCASYAGCGYLDIQ